MKNACAALYLKIFVAEQRDVSIMHYRLSETAHERNAPPWDSSTVEGI